MKKLMTTLAIAGIMTSGAYSQNKKQSFTEWFSREVPAGCQIPCKDPVCPEQCCIKGYVFAYGGGAFLFDDTLGGYNPNAANPFALNVDNGYILGGGVGLRHSALGGVRLEIEHLFSELPVTSVNGVGAFAPAAAGGDVSYTGTFFNVLKEFTFSSMPCVTAYAGGGIGYANVDLNFNRVGAVNFSDSDNALAYQLIAGADYNLCNNIALFLQYKAINIGETDYGFAGALTGTTLENFWTHNVVAGLRFSF